MKNNKLDFKNAFLYGLAGLGSLFALKYSIFRFPRIFYRNFLKRSVPLAQKYGEKSWVIVTGGSRGIGFEFAQQFAKRGFNIAILDQNQIEIQRAVNKLTEINEKLENKIAIKSIAGDIKSPGELERCLIDCDVSILINNAGIAYFIYKLYS